jgi:magnesium transporter
LLLNPPERRIGEIMVREVVAVPSTATVLDACEFFTLHRLLALPVVDERRRILGIVDVGLYTSELADLDRSARNDDLFQLIGVQLAEAQQSSPLVSFRSRFPWLAANIVGGVAAAVALALFIPVVLALSESVGIQSVMLALRVLHGRRPTIRGMFAKVFWEAATGLLLGVAGAAIVGLVAYLWLGQVSVTLALLGGIAGGVACSAVIGLAMPNVLRLLRRDPHVACGPVALALADIATLLIYFYLARWLL